MTPQPSQKPPPRGGDPWHAFSYLVAGVFLYGGLGWLADRWLGTSFLVHPERDLAVIVLTQRMFDTAQAPAVHTDLQLAGLTAAE